MHVCTGTCMYTVGWSHFLHPYVLTQHVGVAFSEALWDFAHSVPVHIIRYHVQYTFRPTLMLSFPPIQNHVATVDFLTHYLNF